MSVSEEPQNWLLHDHRKYEDMVEQCRTAVKSDYWELVESLFRELVSLLKGHFLMEELVLFPAYEKLRGAPQEPSRVLREEHDQIRRVLGILSTALESRLVEDFSASLDSLEDMMERHHEKEEEIFLPMAGHALLERREKIMQELKRHDWRHAMKSWSA